ncbi:hypothetical protein SAMN05216352_1309 [Alteribacillus bidgolensis]|uniref:Uncharacterized protein n=1 Tax=Alteribacillus bidgolensis TaxID=930129 RepID=A0A1G8RNC5_9BACI|nr:hypothetical protein SAMN05216352_1309 [Alteribacillus bidgolensis]
MQIASHCTDDFPTNGLNLGQSECVLRINKYHIKESKHLYHYVSSFILGSR